MSSSVNVSDDEVQQEYKKRNTTFDVSYVVVATDKLAEKIQPRTRTYVLIMTLTRPTSVT